MFKLDLKALAPSEQEGLFFKTLAGYLESGLPLMSNLANAAAVIATFHPELNWVGFYLERDGDLVLGPFQGKPACTRIASGKGVCGTAMAMRQTLLVPDTAKFPGHIVCDSDSKSELVVPIIKNGRVAGVLDLDSPFIGHFSESDRLRFEKAVMILVDFF